MTPRELLVRDYAKLRSRLMRRFGSADFVTEILHETYLRLGAADAVDVVRGVEAYLYRAALNVAADTRDAHRRWIDKAIIEALRRRDRVELEPREIAEARQEWYALLAALDELPPRQRAVFLTARLDELPHKEIAARLGISTDTVDRELKQAFAFFAKRFGKTWRPRRGLSPSDPS
jgi:RNA polymerase sigma-70 factor (ECF subfamily)